MFQVATLLTIVGLTWADDYGKGHYGPYDKMEGYFQYANIPDDYSYETGWNRGNPSHHIGRYEQVQGDTFRTKVRCFASTGQIKSDHSLRSERRFRDDDRVCTL